VSDKQKKDVDQLTDSYVIHLLLQSNLYIDRVDITPELIELKRGQVRMKRSLRESKKTEKESD
jgi:hypothetical protein